MTTDLAFQHRAQRARGIARTAFDQLLAASLALLVWCLPAGVVALILVRGGYRKVAVGDFGGAETRYRLLKRWVIGTFVVAGLFWTWSLVSGLMELQQLWESQR